LAAGFLGLAALAADRQRWRQMAAWLALALLCKEDLGLVVAGFGALLWTTGHPSVGRRTLAAGLGWFVLTALVLIPLANGRASPHLELNYGITGSGPTVVLEAVPTLAQNIWRNVTDGQGATYLLLIFTPFLGCRWSTPGPPPTSSGFRSQSPQRLNREVAAPRGFYSSNRPVSSRGQPRFTALALPEMSRWLSLSCTWRTTMEVVWRAEGRNRWPTM
jgi:hypothetical protein